MHSFFSKLFRKHHHRKGDKKTETDESKVRGSPKTVGKDAKKYQLGEHFITLKHVQTVDKGVPKLDKNVHLRKFDRKAYLASIRGGTRLRSCNTRDTSGPFLAELRGGKWHMKKWDRRPLMEEIRRGKRLTHTTTNDRSAPRLERTKYADFMLSRGRHVFLVDLKRMRRTAFPLKKADTRRDRSLPRLPTKTEWKLRRMNRSSLLAQIKQGRVLKHVQTVDKSVPLYFFKKGEYKFRTNKRKQLLEEIRRGKSLRHVQLNDRSAPVLPRISGEWRWINSMRLPFLDEIQEGVPLKKATTKDRSFPQIPRDYHLRRNDQQHKRLLNEVQKGYRLKHVQTKEMPLKEKVYTPERGEFKLKKTQREDLLKKVRDHDYKLRHVDQPRTGMRAM